MMTLRRRLRSWWCRLWGGHEFYLEHDQSHLYQRCLLCGHESHGWEVLKPKAK